MVEGRGVKYGDNLYSIIEYNLKRALHCLLGEYYFIYFVDKHNIISFFDISENSKERGYFRF